MLSFCARGFNRVGSEDTQGKQLLMVIILELSSSSRRIFGLMSHPQLEACELFEGACVRILEDLLTNRYYLIHIHFERSRPIEYSKLFVVIYIYGMTMLSHSLSTAFRYPYFFIACRQGISEFKSLLIPKISIQRSSSLPQPQLLMPSGLSQKLFAL
ncbi:hypothetical protein FGO68_gene15005 [Halteria grandinella]|uniref:Uncharacterized protein n=1 Tax=Halteria grandinella TaxID=5974 RepID=A0A8J8NJY7_HALGN|nr:hypothetical protein FGO68_gene15005 [Halteria grandinella]